MPSHTSSEQSANRIVSRIGVSKERARAIQAARGRRTAQSPRRRRRVAV